MESASEDATVDDVVASASSRHLSLALANAETKTLISRSLPSADIESMSEGAVVNGAAAEVRQPAAPLDTRAKGPRPILSRFLPLIAMCIAGYISFQSTIDGYMADFREEGGSRFTHADSYLGNTIEDDRNSILGDASPFLSSLEPFTDMSSIRNWGCNLRTAPSIFIHIGKAGGGNIRARFSAAALNYTKDKWSDTDNSFYDLSEEGQGKDVFVNESHKAYFINSKHSNRRPPHVNSTGGKFEGKQNCTARTPIGNAIGCPELSKAAGSRLGSGCPINSDSCRQVYVGHNNFGAEMHWLPVPVLSGWWDSLQINKEHSEEQKRSDRAIREGFESIKLDPKSMHPMRPWCSSPETGAIGRPFNAEEYSSAFKPCSIPISQSIDEDAIKVLGNSLASVPGRPGHVSWAPLYASMPVLRTTVVREPFSWFLSKLYWHVGPEYKNKTCSDPDFDFELFNQYALDYIYFICGEDCRVRYLLDGEDVTSIASQAEGNLRHSIAVVGLWNETDTFNDMLSARFSYLDMTRNPEVKGRDHSSRKRAGYMECIEIFANTTFQARLLSKYPAIAELQRLFEVAVEVNRYQQRELRTCSNIKIRDP